MAMTISHSRIKTSFSYKICLAKYLPYCTLVRLLSPFHFRYLLLNLSFYLGASHFDTPCYPCFVLCLNQNLTVPVHYMVEINPKRYLFESWPSIVPGDIVPNCRPSMKKSCNQTFFSSERIIRYIP